MRPPTLGATPPKAWRSWNAFALDVDERRIYEQAIALSQPGPNGAPSLLQLGYNEVGIDDGWQSCTGHKGTWHSAAGAPLVDNAKFSDLRALVARVHAIGVKVGWYVNTCWCNDQEHRVWPRGNVRADAELVLKHGFDAVKIDGCGPARDMREWTRFFANTSMLVENCANNGKIGGKSWTPAKPHDVVGSKCRGFHTYRVSHDIAPQFYSAMYNLQKMRPFLGNGTKAPLSRPGCWAYADMLMVGRIGPRESRTHFGAWCIVSSPLVLGFDLTNATALAHVRPIVSNPLALLVHSAWAGSPGTLLLESAQSFETQVRHEVDEDGSCKRPTTCEQFRFPNYQVWIKPLPADALALFVVNIAEHALKRVSLSSATLGFKGPLKRIVDVWAGASVQHHDCLGSNRSATAWAGCSLEFTRVAPHDSVFWILEGHPTMSQPPQVRAATHNEGKKGHTSTSPSTAHPSIATSSGRAQHQAAAFRKSLKDALARTRGSTLSL